MSINEFNSFVNPVLLRDIRNEMTGELHDWQKVQIRKKELEDSYRRIAFSDDFDTFKYSHKFVNRIERIYNCARYIEFKRILKTNDLKVHKFYTCKDRLCPGCNPRRSRKIYNQFKKISDYCSDDYEFIFLTLTVRNCDMGELDDLISHMFGSWKKFCKRTEFKNAVVGWYRALEVTFDHDEIISEKKYNRSKNYFDKIGLKIGDKNPNYKKFHPHFHCLLAVNKNYFSSRDYLSQSDFVRLWCESLDVDYVPVVDVRKVHTIKSSDEIKNKSDIISEVAKYTVKDTDYLIKDNLDLTDLTVYYLALALQGRRLIAFGGELKKIHKKLNLDDAIDGDLVNIDDDITEDDDYIIECYNYKNGYYGEDYYLSSLKLPEHFQQKEDVDHALLFRNAMENELSKSKRKKNAMDTINEYNMNVAMNNKFVFEHNGEKNVSHLVPKEETKQKKIKLDEVETISQLPANFDVKSVLRLFNHNNNQISKISYNDLKYLNYYMQKENNNSSLSKKVLKSCVKNLSGTKDVKKIFVLKEIYEYLSKDVNGVGSDVKPHLKAYKGVSTELTDEELKENIARAKRINEENYKRGKNYN